MSNSYINFLRTRKPIKLTEGSKLLGETQKETPRLVAPLNADITFVTPKTKLAKPKVLLGAIPLPKNWNNFTGTEEKYQLTTRPMNQGLCGSCFACSSATSISDAFVFAGLNFNPNLSPMFILACFDQNAQCGGGNAHLVLNQVEQNGIVSNHCLDYESICNNNPYCTSQSNQDEINNMIPPCGCCAIGKNSFCAEQPTHYKYFVKNVEVAAINANEVMNSDNAQEINVDTIKNHIYKFGGAVSGFQVYSNFLNGGTSNFASTKGIYFETEPYDTDSPDAFQGCHAISIVGWGVEENPIKLSNGVTISNTPYWVVRNSWGTKWGDNGYFKFAMYQKQNDFEVNPSTALERININKIDNSQSLGGIILFEPSSYSEYDDSKSDCSYLNNLEERNKLQAFYCNEESPSENIPQQPDTPGDSDKKKESIFNLRNIAIFAGVIIILGVLIMLLKNKKEN